MSATETQAFDQNELQRVRDGYCQLASLPQLQAAVIRPAPDSQLIVRSRWTTSGEFRLRRGMRQLVRLYLVSVFLRKDRLSRCRERAKLYNDSRSKFYRWNSSPTELKPPLNYASIGFHSG